MAKRRKSKRRGMPHNGLLQYAECMLCNGAHYTTANILSVNYTHACPFCKGTKLLFSTVSKRAMESLYSRNMKSAFGGNWRIREYELRNKQIKQGLHL